MQDNPAATDLGNLCENMSRIVKCLKSLFRERNKKYYIYIVICEKIIQKKEITVHQIL